MKALVLTEYMKLEFLDVPMPEIGEEEVLIKIKAAAVCGSDIHGINGKSLRRKPPLIMGHEASGTIEKIGAKVKGHSIGERVTFNSAMYCQNCDFCKQGLFNLCDHGKVVGVANETFHKDGAFAEYLALPAHLLYTLPPSLSFEDASLIEPIAVALHGIKLLPLTEDSSVMVLGTGTIGLFALQLLVLKNYPTIIVAGRNPKRLKLAKELGATHIINTAESNIKDEVLNITGGKGLDCTYDTAGAESTFKAGLDCLKKGGTFTTIANLSPSFPINMTELIMKQLTLKGSCVSNGEYAEVLEYMGAGKIRTDYVISKVIPLSEGEDFILDLHHNRIPDFGKLILIP